MSDQTLVGFVDDHPVLVAALARTLQEHVPGMTEVVTVATVEDLVATSRTFSLVLLDLHLGVAAATSPEENVSFLVRRGWPVLLYTQDTRPLVIARCLQAGAAGVVGKSEPLTELVAAVRSVLQGEPLLNTEWALAIESVQDRIPLPPREKEAVKLYATGLPLKSVARKMGISVETANEYLRRVRARYHAVGRDAHTRTDLIKVATEDGHIEPMSPFDSSG